MENFKEMYEGANEITFIINNGLNLQEMTPSYNVLQEQEELGKVEYSAEYDEFVYKPCKKLRYLNQYQLDDIRWALEQINKMYINSREE